MAVANFIDNTHRVPGAVEGWCNVYNPSRGEIIEQAPLSGPAEVDAAVASAARAFPGWSNMPVSKRAAVLFKYKELLEVNTEPLARLVTLENGKTIEEARGDVRRGIEVVDFACGIAHLAKGENLPQVADQIDAATMREPIGVCAGITPFNFPAMVPLWMFPIAIACGNSFILKPSEKVPLTAIRLAELFAEAGLPPGVLNIVHGGRAAVDALCTHPDIVAVSFVGSSAVAQHVYTLACSHGKRCQAAGGAKNALLVMSDADPDATLRAIIGSAFGCSGQRCMAGSLLLPVGEKTAEFWREAVSGALRKLKVADTSADDAAEMGPVIDEAARRRVEDFIASAPKFGADVAFSRRDVPDRGFFAAPTLLDRISADMPAFQQEIFGPVLSLARPATLDEAIAMMRQIPYGNGATIFTSSGAAARQFAREAPCGMIGINIGVPAPMAPFAFSGWNRSFYGDLHVQGKEGVLFYTRQRIVLSRWDRNYVRQQGW